VAHGDHGVRLLTMDGRIRARWDLPVHALVVADHGGSALLIRRSATLSTIHRLDLAERRIRLWTTLPSWTILPSFDGSVLTVIDDDGLAFLDTLSDRPKVLWRELDRTQRVGQDINRSPEALTALVGIEPGNVNKKWRLELISWELPSLTLRLRRPIEDQLEQFTATLPGRFVTSDLTNLSRYVQHQKPVLQENVFRLPYSSGEALGLMSGEGVFEIEVKDRLVATVDCPDQRRPGLRLHDGLVTVWTQDGRVAVIDSGNSKVLGNLRTRL
jgi:hypothetical protein